uniref:Receptor expression-enhancing protein n=1 Tax=Anopheles coluzzii TaxID=1518534 RepID=A0A8W7PFW5_ANOCL
MVVLVALCLCLGSFLSLTTVVRCTRLRSYKAVRTKNVKEYVKWMMYWIVFAFFTFIETFTDILLSWFPFYYEIKVIVVLWLLSPATRGSSTLYRKFVHPMLTRREQVS